MMNGRLAPIRTPPASDDGSSSVISAVPPYAASSGLISICDDKKPSSPTLSSPYGSMPSSPARPPLPIVPNHRQTLAAAEPARPISTVFSDVESLIDGFVGTFPSPSPSSRSIMNSSPFAAAMKGKDSADASVEAEDPADASERDVPDYGAVGDGRDDVADDLRRMEERKERPPPAPSALAPEEEERHDSQPSKRTIEEWREQQERERQKAQSILPSSSSVSSARSGSTSTLSARAQGRPRPTQGPVATETAAQHHFRLAQQHLQAAQRLALLTSPISSAVAHNTSDVGSIYSPSEDPGSPESAVDEPFEFDHYPVASLPQRSNSLALSYVSSSSMAASTISRSPSSADSSADGFYDPHYGAYRSQVQPYSQTPYREPSISSLNRQQPRNVASYDTFGRDAGGYARPEVAQYQRREENDQMEQLNSREREGSLGREAFVPSRPAPSPPSSRERDRERMLPSPESFTQEHVYARGQPRQDEWRERQHHRAYSPSEISIATTSSPLPTYQPPQPRVAAPRHQLQHQPQQREYQTYSSAPSPPQPRPVAYAPPPSQHQSTYVPHQQQQPTSYILSPQGVPIPVYSSFPPPLPPAPRQALAVHSQPLQYDHRLPFASTTSPTQYQPPPAPQQLQPVAGQQQRQNRGILKPSSSSSDLLNLARPQPQPTSSPSTSFSYQATSPVQLHRTPSVASSSTSADDRPFAPTSGKSRMASLRQGIARVASPHVRFQSPAPSDSSFGSTGGGAVAGGKAQGKSRDDAVAQMNMTFKMLM